MNPPLLQDLIEIREGELLQEAEERRLANRAGGGGTSILAYMVRTRQVRPDPWRTSLGLRIASVVALVLLAAGLAS